MKEIKDQTFENVTLFMDDVYYRNCKIKNCTLIYTGGDYGWSDTTIDTCALRFEGSSDRTVKYLGFFRLLSIPFAKDLKMDVAQQESVLETEIQRSRDALTEINTRLVNINSLNYQQQVSKCLKVISEYFIPQSRGKADGISL